MKRLLVLLTAMTAVLLAAAKPVKVACIGNSITYGSTLADPSTDSYPSQLARLLGEGYVVGNFGRPGATLLNNGHNPYMASEEWARAKEFRPDIAIIHLGINDTDPRDWPYFNRAFKTDYLSLIDTLCQINPDVRIYIANLSPLLSSHWRFRSGTRVWRDKIREEISKVAAESGCTLIDFNTPLHDRHNLIHDSIHPNEEGAKLLASYVYGAITGDYGGLRLSPVMSDGMVLQRDEYLTLHGRANAGAAITLRLGGRSYHTTADAEGFWKVKILPLVANGRKLTLTVTDGRDTVTVRDILAGEVWMASGQSNMAFPLRDATGGPQTIAASSDSLLRFFVMEPIALTDNTTWSDSIRQRVNDLRYFEPKGWHDASPEVTPGVSAVAYFFARELRDSLRVPVGIIQNAVGGSGIESWIDVEKLRAVMPELLNDWSRNDYVQPWVRGRAIQNMGGDQKHLRHPYEPSYLFSTAISPLERFPVRGIIWYQGESNEHNIEIHEALFPTFVANMREYFGKRDLPFNFVQLSSLSRPSWGEFRNMQTVLRNRVGNIGMAVSLDHGDSLDVHPHDKAPVGDRLARLALSRTYHRAIEAAGPEPLIASSRDGAVWITMSAAPKSLDGKPLRYFEIASDTDPFRPARAEIIGNKIKVYNMNVKNPTVVRYAWESFVRPNLVSEAGLPSPTFEIEAENAGALEIEAGLDAGVSAPFCGAIADRVIVAGGCNFPEHPMAPNSVKRYYRGIYALTDDNRWQKIGNLPETMAYGATAATDSALVLIGGDNGKGATDAVRMLQLDGLTPRITDLSALPGTLDNMAAAAIGRTVYVAGGNYDGVPSTRLFALDLDNESAGWKELAPMPGNPRVQPVMAASGGKLYLWGGFACRHEGHEPSLELDGLCYNPANNKWSPLPAPETVDGEKVSLGGGVAVTLPTGTIATIGGVNKDVFLEALRNQAPDYLSHEPEWYRFNDHLLIFDPRKGKWSDFGRQEGAARAGAGAAADSKGRIYINGGEVKPRIRTAEFMIISPYDYSRR